MSASNGFTFRQVAGVTAIVGVTVSMAAPFVVSNAGAIRKSKAFEGAHRLGMAMLAYTVDNGEELPCGTIPNLSDRSRIRYRPSEAVVQNPAGWFHEDGMEDEHRLVWNNSIAGYLPKNSNLGTYGKSPIELGEQPWSGGYLAVEKPPTGINLTYNGYLQYLRTSEIDSAPDVPLLWQGQGDVTRSGAAMTNPRLNCNGSGPCRFSATRGVQADSSGDPSVMNVLLDSANYKPTSGRNLYVFADGGAKPVYFGRGNQLAFPESVDSWTPFQYIDDEGTVSQSFLRACALPAGPYVAAFIPGGKDRCGSTSADTIQAVTLRIDQSGR